MFVNGRCMSIIVNKLTLNQDSGILHALGSGVHIGVYSVTVAAALHNWHAYRTLRQHQ